MRIRSTETASKLDPKALPCIVSYRGGDVLESFVRVHELLPSDFEFEDIEWLLEEKDLLIVPNYDNCLKYKTEQEAKKMKQVQKSSSFSSFNSTRKNDVYDDQDSDQEEEDVAVSGRMKKGGKSSSSKRIISGRIASI